MLYFPAHSGSKPIPEGTALKDDAFCRLIIGILLTRMDGGKATFTQEDFDKAVGMLVLEGRSAKGEFMLGIQGRGDIAVKTPRHNARDYGLTMLCVLLAPVILLAAFMVRWLVAGINEGEDD